MSRKRKLIILISALVIALPALHYTMGLFKRHNCFTAHYDKLNGDVRMVFYGELSHSDALLSIWAERHGFKYKRIAGCNVSAPLINGAKMYNNVMRSTLDEKLGSGWEDRMMSEIDTLYSYMSEVSTNGMTHEEAYQYQLKEGFLLSMIAAAKRNEKVLEMERIIKSKQVPDPLMRTELSYSIERDSGEAPVYTVSVHEVLPLLNGRVMRSRNHIKLKLDSATRRVISSAR